MGILLSFCNTQLGHTILGNNLTKGVGDGFRRICNLYIKAFLVLSHGNKGELQSLALKTAKLNISKCMSQLTGAVRTEVEEYNTISILHSLVVTYNSRNYELISYLICIRCLNACHCIISSHALAQRNGLISLLYTIPAVVAVHCIITTGQGSNLTTTDFSNLRLQLCNIFSCGGRINITAIKECMNIYILEALVLSEL